MLLKTPYKDICLYSFVAPPSIISSIRRQYRFPEKPQTRSVKSIRLSLLWYGVTDLWWQLLQITGLRSGDQHGTDLNSAVGNKAALRTGISVCLFSDTEGCIVLVACYSSRLLYVGMEILAPSSLVYPDTSGPLKSSISLLRIVSFRGHSECHT